MRIPFTQKNEEEKEVGNIFKIEVMISPKGAYQSPAGMPDHVANDIINRGQARFTPNNWRMTIH